MDYKVLILDLDGTLYIDGIPIKDIVPKLNKYKKKGNRLFYLSNNTSVGRKTYLDKLSNIGLKVSLEEIISPILVAGEYLEKKYSEGFIVGTNDLIQELTSEYNIKTNMEEPEFVLISFDTELTYSKLRKATEFINKGIPYYITHIDIACPTNKGFIPDCGAISYMIESVTKVKPIDNFGKPSDRMIAYLKKRIGESNLMSDVLMVGDRLYTDIALGNSLGIKSLLVLTGESKLKNTKKSLFKPDHCSPSLPDFFEGVDLLKK